MRVQPEPAHPLFDLESSQDSAWFPDTCGLHLLEDLVNGNNRLCRSTCAYYSSLPLVCMFIAVPNAGERAGTPAANATSAAATTLRWRGAAEGGEGATGPAGKNLGYASRNVGGRKVSEVHGHGGDGADSRRRRQSLRQHVLRRLHAGRSRSRDAAGELSL